MDLRREQLKRLKKAYRKKRRGCVCVWTVLAVLFFLVALAAAGILYVPLIPAVILVQVLPEAAVAFLVGNVWVIYAAGGAGAVLCVLFACISGKGKRKLLKSREYLDYRTLRNTLKAEKRAI